MDIDLYEFKETIKRFEEKDLNVLKLCSNKGVAIIEIENSNKTIHKKLRSLGHKVGDRVLVVVQ